METLRNYWAAFSARVGSRNAALVVGFGVVLVVALIVAAS
jgi:hypothetical protein